MSNISFDVVSGGGGSVDVGKEVGELRDVVRKQFGGGEERLTEEERIGVFERNYLDGSGYATQYLSDLKADFMDDVVSEALAVLEEELGDLLEEAGVRLEDFPDLVDALSDTAEEYFFDCVESEARRRTDEIALAVVDEYGNIDVDAGVDILYDIAQSCVDDAAESAANDWIGEFRAVIEEEIKERMG